MSKDPGPLKWSLHANSPRDKLNTLIGWKEIARYLGKSVRTVQRWEKDLELPTQRRGESVSAMQHDIDVWRATVWDALAANSEVRRSSSKDIGQDTIWERVLRRVERRVNPHSFATWFSPTRQERLEDGRLLVSVPTRLFCKRLAETYGELLQSVLNEIDQPDLVLEFVVSDQFWSSQDIAQPSSDRGDAGLNVRLNPRYTFETFVVGSSNQFAHAAAIAVSLQPAKSYNPLFLYGGVGLGKTHLMQAIGNALHKRNPNLRVAYMSSEKFTNEVISAIRMERMAAFRDRFRSLDVLMIDDVQFMATRERTQEEFFHTFNALYDDQKQIIISADCPPKRISSIEERLRSRFEWGLIADFQPPDLETKIAILQKKAEAERAYIPSDVTEYIAQSVKSNIREVEGALIRLLAYTALTGTEINLDTARRVLHDIIEPQEKRFSIERIQEEVGLQLGVDKKEFKKRDDAKNIALARQIAIFLARRLTPASVLEIGRQFGGRTEASVLNAIEKIEQRCRTDKDFDEAMNAIIQCFE
jgi:chromosomal replication initiator protein